MVRAEASKGHEKDILSHLLRDRRIVRHRLGHQSWPGPIRHCTDGRSKEELGRLEAWRREREVHQVHRAANVRFETVTKVNNVRDHTVSTRMYVPEDAQVEINRPGVLEGRVERKAKQKTG